MDSSQVICCDEMEGDTHRPTASTYPCEAVPRPNWEIATDFGLSLLQHRRDQQPCAPQQLAVHAPRVGIFGEPGRSEGAAPQQSPSRTHCPMPSTWHSLKEQWPCHRVPSHVCPVEEGVKVGQEGVAEAEGPPHGILCSQAKGIGFLWL